MIPMLSLKRFSASLAENDKKKWAKDFFLTWTCDDFKVLGTQGGQLWTPKIYPKYGPRDSIFET